MPRNLPSTHYFCTGIEHSSPILVTLKFSGIDLEMEFDTGATLSVISEQTYHKLLFAGKAPTLRNVTTQLTTYTGEAIEILGEVEVTVQYKGQEKQLKLLIVIGEGPSLLSRNWLSHIKLDWSQLYHLKPLPHQLRAVNQFWTNINLSLKRDWAP